MSDALARNLKHYRKLRKMTQRQLAEAVGISEMSIRRYESTGADNREPLIQTIIKLSKALNVSVQDLISPKIVISINDSDPDEIEEEKNNLAFLNRMDFFYSMLNDSGLAKAIEQVELLTKIPEYQKETSDHLAVNAAHARTDVEVTDEMKKYDDDLLDD